MFVIELTAVDGFFTGRANRTVFDMINGGTIASCQRNLGLCRVVVFHCITIQCIDTGVDLGNILSILLDVGIQGSKVRRNGSCFVNVVISLAVIESANLIIDSCISICTSFLFVIELITIDSIFGVFFYLASFDVRNLVIADAYIAATNSGHTVRTKGNLSPCGLVADRSDARQVLSQLQIIRDLAIFIRGFMEQDVLASIDAFILFIIFTSFRTAFYGQSCMRSAGFISFCTDVVVDFLQITKVSCILQSIAGCCSNRSIFTFCIFGTIESTLDVRDLVTTDIDITTSDSSRSIGAKGNLSAGGYVFIAILSSRLIADGRDTRQIFCQLDFQLAIRRAVDADVAFCQVALRTTDDIKSVVQLLGNDFRCIVLGIITSIFHTVFHGSYLVFTVLVGVDDASNAICAVNAVSAIDAFVLIIVAVLDNNIGRRAIPASKADMTF